MSFPIRCVFTIADTIHCQGNVFFTKNGLLKGLNETNKPASVHYIARHWCLESRVTYKHDNAVNSIGLQTSNFFNGFGVFEVLPQRILKSYSLFEDFLRPLRLLLRAEYPAPHILSLDNEDAELRYNNMVDLSRTIDRWKRNVVQSVVTIFIEEQAQHQNNKQFAKHPLHDRKFYEPDEKQYWKHPPNLSY